jgi:lysyl-tRNA synthetase, class II
MVTMLTTVYRFFRPVKPGARLTPEDEVRIRELLAKHGHRDSLGYFALRRDKSVVWSPTGKACITYRVVSGVMLASGDPIGDPEAWPGAIKVFMEMADKRVWVPAVAGCNELGGRIWCREAGLNALDIGDEAICEVADFTLEGRAMRNVRQMIHRVERQGYTTRIDRVKNLTAEEKRLIVTRTADWRGAGTERGFSMALSRFGDPADDECVTVRAFDKEGEMRAFLHFVPWGQEGLSLDLMRRDCTAAPGLNELLIVAALRSAPTIGVKRLSLSFVPFRSSLERGERLGAEPVVKVWARSLIFLSRWFQIESLYRFNAKFRPIWEPRFTLYRSTVDMPRIAIAYLAAEAFIVTPDPLSLPKLLSRHAQEQLHTLMRKPS